MSSDTQITVSRTIDASAHALFDVLRNLERRPDLDQGSLAALAEASPGS